VDDDGKQLVVCSVLSAGILMIKVIDSRPLSDGAAIRRRRECLNCGHRYTTYEEIERDNLRVQKRDGRYEAFDRKKLLMGMEKASEKRPISRAVLERACERIIRELTEEYGEEFPSVAIGEKVMEKLRAIDEVGVCAVCFGVSKVSGYS
jgi:transcriptional repressor NrdR